jgi:hypothetical protein
MKIRRTKYGKEALEKKSQMRRRKRRGWKSERRMKR